MPSKEVHGPGGMTVEAKTVPEYEKCEEGETVAEDGCYEAIASLGHLEVRRQPEGYTLWIVSTGERIGALFAHPEGRMTALKSLADLTTRNSAAPWKTWRREAREAGITKWVR